MTSEKLATRKVGSYPKGTTGYSTDVYFTDSELLEIEVIPSIFYVIPATSLTITSFLISFANSEGAGGYVYALLIGLLVATVAYLLLTVTMNRRRKRIAALSVTQEAGGIKLSKIPWKEIQAISFLPQRRMRVRTARRLFYLRVSSTDFPRVKKAVDANSTGVKLN